MISRTDIEDMTDAQDARREIVRLWGITHGRDFSWHQHMDIAVEQLRADLPGLVEVTLACLREAADTVDSAELARAIRDIGVRISPELTPS